MQNHRSGYEDHRLASSGGGSSVSRVTDFPRCGRSLFVVGGVIDVIDRRAVHLTSHRGNPDETHVCPGMRDGS